MILYSVPYPFVYSGIFMLAVGYGLDLNERVGCTAFPYGLIAGPCFPLLTVAVLKYSQWRRRRSGMIFSNSRMRLGKAIFLSWTDLLVSECSDDDNDDDGNDKP